MANNDISKYLSYILCHNPSDAGITLDSQGWVEVDELIEKVSQKGYKLTSESLTELVNNNNKKRFAFSDGGMYIRANQGHSIEVDLGYKDAEPPKELYHGTAERFLDVILDQGLKPMSRHAVHMSPDEDTAIKVGKRHGEPVVILIDALQMHQDGHKFQVSDNGVWLTDAVDPKYFKSIL